MRSLLKTGMIDREEKDETAATIQTARAPINRPESGDKPAGLGSGGST
jgi:hypothetical protein